MKKNRKYISAILHYLLFFLFTGYYSSTTMFYHAHTVNGHIVVHSHLYKHVPGKKSPFQSHNHSPAAYNLIHIFNKTNWKEAPTIAQTPKPVVIDFGFAVNYFPPDIISNYYFLSPLRAPPVIC